MKVEYIAGTEELDNLLSKQEIDPRYKQELDKTINPPKYDIISEGYNPDDKRMAEKENSKMNQLIENGWLNFVNWIKKSIAMMIIFILIGAAGGMYLSKIIYNYRMDEITKMATTGNGGFVYSGHIYDVKLRP